MRLDSAQIGVLFEVMVRGMMANMALYRGTNLSGDQWDMIHGQREITTRDLAEFAFDMGARLELHLLDLAPSVPQPAGATDECQQSQEGLL